MNKSILSPFFLTSLFLVTLIIGLAGGFILSPTYQMGMMGTQEMGLGPADRFVDWRYLNQMATHHQGAMELAKQVETQSSRPEVRALAADILAGEPKLIAELQTWKKAWFRDGRPAPKPVVAQLGSADDKLDLRFLNALIAHHEAGIEMTREVRSKSSRSEVLNNADAVEQFLMGSSEKLQQWRHEWYGVAVPSTPAEEQL